MHDIQQALANEVRNARIERGLSQEKLAEILGFDSRTILNIEAGRGNPKLEKLYPLISYLKIPAERIFSPQTASPSPSLQKLLTELNGCSEEEAADLLPMIRYLLALIRKQDTPSL
jgi:transcriptional regulator with XRE-family HTH domain